MSRIPFYLHNLGDEEIESITRALRGEILTTGDIVKEFESAMAAYLRQQHFLGMSSCTAALHISLKSLGIGEGDEVITTPMTFIATATAIIEAGAKPVFVDVEADTGNIDADKIAAAVTDRTKAIVPVHLYGLMCDMKKIRAIADRFQLGIVEDSAHCVEGERDGVKPGQLADTACFSFYATKNLTCGEGGGLVTNNNELMKILRPMHLHGMTKTAADRQKEGYKHWDMVDFGWKCNMSNLQAALLLPQVRKIEQTLSRREQIAQCYIAGLQGIKGVQIPHLPKNTRHARHLFPIWVDATKRDYVVNELQKRNIGVVVNYRAIHLLSYFKNKYGFREGTFVNAENIGNRTLSLPFYNEMSEDSVVLVCDAIRRILK